MSLFILHAASYLSADVLYLCVLIDPGQPFDIKFTTNAYVVSGGGPSALLTFTVDEPPQKGPLTLTPQSYDVNVIFDPPTFTIQVGETISCQFTVTVVDPVEPAEVDLLVLCEGADIHSEYMMLVTQPTLRIIDGKYPMKNAKA